LIYQQHHIEPEVLLRLAAELDKDLPDCIEQILESRAFRRLESISQLGSVSYFMPEAVHSRARHSMGVCAMVIQIFLRMQGALPQQRIKGIVLYALLHDIGHLPFSHEMEWILGIHHESITEALLHTGPLADILDKHKLREQLMHTRQLIPMATFERDIMNSCFDADRMDYLARDNEHCFGIIFPALAAALTGLQQGLSKVQNAREIRLGISPDNVADVLICARERQRLFEQVYLSPAAIFAKLVNKYIMARHARLFDSLWKLKAAMQRNDWPGALTMFAASDDTTLQRGLEAAARIDGEAANLLAQAHHKPEEQKEFYQQRDSSILVNDDAARRLMVNNRHRYNGMRLIGNGLVECDHLLSSWLYLRDKSNGEVVVRDQAFPEVGMLMDISPYYVEMYPEIKLRSITMAVHNPEYLLEDAL
jgi:HD superfamily phosphohydrolase